MKTKLNILLFLTVYLLSGCVNNKCKPNEFEDHFVAKDSKFSFDLQRGSEEVVSLKGDTETVRGFDSYAPKQTIYVYQRLRLSKDSTIRAGFFKTFYANGHLRSLTYYNQGKENGIGKYYFPNGVLEAKGFSYNGENIGTQEVFDSSGRMHLALIPKNNKEYWLEARYDHTGRINSIKGSSFCVRGHIEPKMKAGEKFKNVLIEVPDLKRTSAVLNISVHNKKETIFDTSFIKFHNLYNSNFIDLNYRFKSNAKGKYELKIMAQLTDSLSHRLLKEDSFKCTIIVL